MLVPLVAYSSLYKMITERDRVPRVVYILPIFSTTAKGMLLKPFLLSACMLQIWGSGQTSCDIELKDYYEYIQ
jgi:hypothetical protein